MFIGKVHREYLQKLEKDALQGVDKDHVFNFECREECMGLCCQEIEIFLDPWDVETLSRHLGITGQEFVREYCLLEMVPEWNWPVVKFRHAAEGPCAFLRDDNLCRVYPVRPRNCRAHPVGRAVRFTPGDPPRKEERLFLLPPNPGCLCHGGERRWTMDEWIADSELEHYHELSDLHLELVHYAVETLRSREWLHEDTARMIIPFLYAPEILRARLNIPDSAVDHEEFYRRRLLAVKVVLTDLAAVLGYGPRAGQVSEAEPGTAFGGNLMDRVRPVLRTGRE